MAETSASPDSSSRADSPTLPAWLKKRAQARHRVVVLGGGFAGVYTARRLSALLRGRSDVHVELLSEENYFVFQPLLPEVAAGGVSPTHVVNPIRDMVPGVQFRWSKVQRVDVEKKVVYALQGPGKELVAVPYDHLVFALGKVSNFSSMPGVQEHALAMKDLSDAFRLRNHVYRCLELADVEDDPAEKAALLTFVVAGGGFSGVETIGELSEMLRKVKKSFANIDAHEIRLVLVHSRETLLAEMPLALGQAAADILRRRGVQIVVNARTRAASRHAVYLSTGEKIPTRTFVCTVGNAPNPICKEILDGDGFVEGKSGGRGIGVFQTDLYLQCVGHDQYWAVGDCAGVPMPGKPQDICPATAQFAIRQGDVCARNILAAIDGRPERRREFTFRGLGTLASLGNRSAVADMMGFQLRGFWAWFAWRTIYLSKLPGVIRRLRVTVDWTLDLFFPRDITQLQPDDVPQLRVEHYEPGELIIGRDEIGRELFVIQQGEVEVRAAEGNVLATLGHGEVFGEKALLTDAPRTADVVAKSAVDVLVMTRAGFRALVQQLEPLDEFFSGLMRQRYPQLVPSDARATTLGHPPSLSSPTSPSLMPTSVSVAADALAR
jgi:NADH dehydrogenase